MHPNAGQIATDDMLVNIPRLVSAYYAIKPEHDNVAQQVAFGTSGHRGTAFNGSFNETHILAISQAICEYRHQQGITGPIYVGMDTHALSEPALISAVEVFAANNMDVMIDKDRSYTPTPVISHAILTHNRQHSALADGVVITPSHNPPADGGFKYNPPHGGPAETAATKWIEQRANVLISENLQGVKRIGFDAALNSGKVHLHDFTTPYVNDLENVLDMRAIADAKLKIGVDPLGGSGLLY